MNELLNNNILVENNIKNNLNYRKFLQNNALNVIKNNQLQACDKCDICPYKISLYDNIKKPFFNFLDKNSDLKDNYLNEQKLSSRLFTKYNL